jgi:hypothetical protein
VRSYGTAVVPLKEGHGDGCQSAAGGTTHWNDAFRHRAVIPTLWTAAYAGGCLTGTVASGTQHFAAAVMARRRWASARRITPGGVQRQRGRPRPEQTCRAARRMTASVSTPTAPAAFPEPPSGAAGAPPQPEGGSSESARPQCAAGAATLRVTPARQEDPHESRGKKTDRVGY